MQTDSGGSQFEGVYEKFTIVARINKFLVWHLNILTDSFASMSFLITRMKSTSTKIIWWAIDCSAFTTIRPWTFNWIQIVWTVSITCSKTRATRCRTITPWCPIGAVGCAIFTRFCWASDRIWKRTRSLSRNSWNRTVSSFGFITATTCYRAITPIRPHRTIIITRIWTTWSTCLEI